MLPTVVLPGGSLSTTCLGFGCNSLLGPKPRSEGLALLAEAYECGIRHFDVARAYSSGDAEGVVGEFLVGKRESVSLTTKFGLQPPSGAASKLSWLKPLARRIMRVSPSMRKAIESAIEQDGATGSLLSRAGSGQSGNESPRTEDRKGRSLAAARSSGKRLFRRASRVLGRTGSKRPSRSLWSGFEIREDPGRRPRTTCLFAAAPV